MKKQKTSTNKGFSMIELIIVIAIMAILIAVLAPVYTRYLERARRSDDTILADHLKTAVETTLVDPEIVNPTNGSYALVAATLPILETTYNTDFWNNVAGIMKSTWTVGSNLTQAAGLLDDCRSTGASEITIVINGDTATVTITNSGDPIVVD